MRKVLPGSGHPELDQTLGSRLINVNAIEPACSNSDLEVDFDDVRLDVSPAPPAVPDLSPVAAAGFGIVLAFAGLACLESRLHSR
jgi:hypothetical protein